MVAQTLLPERWVIVDDGSTDNTAEIVESYARRYPWIELIRRQPRQTAVLPAKVHAFNAGLERVQSVPFEVIGNLDADLSFEPDYLEFLDWKVCRRSAAGCRGNAVYREWWLRHDPR